MKWSISIRLMPGEEIVGQDNLNTKFGLMPTHSAVLTNRRAIFRFNSLNTKMVQSFDISEIESAEVVSRLLIKYLKMRAGGKDYYYNVETPEEWAGRISAAVAVNKAAPAREPVKVSLGELLMMLETLKKYGLLTEDEFEVKRKMII